jgi:excisionase family DNA binding protein
MEAARRFLTRSQVARLFGVSPHTVTRWAHEERVPCIVTPGGQFRFPEEPILALANRDRKEGGTTMTTKKTKKTKEESKVAHCPRCGSELYSISDMDLAGHFVRCSKCGFSDEMVDQKGGGQVSDIEIERAARGM